MAHRSQDNRNETEAIDLAIERMRTIYEMTEETSKRPNSELEELKQSRRAKTDTG